MWLRIRGCACQHLLRITLSETTCRQAACAHDAYSVQGRTAPCFGTFSAARKVAVSFAPICPHLSKRSSAAQILLGFQPLFISSCISANLEGTY